MKQKLFTFKSGLLTKLLLSFTLLLTGVGNIWADDVTVYGSSSGNSVGVPFNANKVGDNYVRSEFIYSSSEENIASLAGKEITKIKLYTTNSSADNTTCGDAIFKVYLKEVTQSSFSAPISASSYWGYEDATVVYEGSLTLLNHEMEITFTNSFMYSGTKNLLVGFCCTTKGSNAGYVYFLGNSSTGSTTAVFSTSYTSSATFLPRTTFSYNTPAVSILFISPNEDADFGTVWANDSKDYVITNNSGSTVNVVPSITGDDKALFSVSPESADITSGSTQTFTLNFNYDASSLGDKEATITFKPDDDDKNVITKDITVKAVPKLQISSTDGTFGNVTADASKVYTITNHTGETVSITPSISGSNADMFSVSPDEETEIDDGESQVFTVTFDWQADVAKLGEKTATIAFTPDNGYAAFDIEASATATVDAVLDESNTTTWTSGSGKSVLIKYQPVVGWNTLCLPITASNNITNIFGSTALYGTKYYSFTSYDAGVLTFTKTTSYIAANTPCLVYVTSAKDNSAGILLTGEYVYQPSNATPGVLPASPSTPIMQGTYTGLDMEDKYGLTPSGKIMKGGAGSNIKGFRAYFTNVSAPASGVKMMILEGDDETDLGFVKMVDENAKDVYTLTGQKVQKGRKGIYIVNGKKVVIK